MNGTPFAEIVYFIIAYPETDVKRLEGFIAIFEFFAKKA
jgi:hypothetical protein